MLVGVLIFKEVFCWGVEVFYVFKKIFKECGFEIVVGDEGGFVFKFEGIEDGVEIIFKVIEVVGYEVGENGIMIGFDCVLLEFYDVECKVYDYGKFEGEGGVVCIVVE